MPFDDPTPTVLVTSRDPRVCAEAALVLEAQSIPSQTERVGDIWILSVPAAEIARARAELNDYARENPPGRRVHSPPRWLGSGWPGVIGYLAVIVLTMVATRQMSLGADWLGLGRMDAGRLLQGEWWRAVTALTLHADAAHLLANAAFGGFFGYAIGRSFGSGFGWLVILVGGAAGNVLNALVNGPEHRSIGASTAVFAALGLLTAFSWRRGFPVGARGREKIAPIIAGIGLLAYTGVGGENTDIGAHLMGFLAGFGLGLGVALFGPPERRSLQLASAALAGLIVVGAWIAAFVAG